VVYKSDGEEVGRSDLVMAVDVQKAGFSHMMKKLMLSFS